MPFSIKKFGLDGATLVQGLFSKNKWTEDLKRGLVVLQSGGVAVVDRSFAEVELHKLRGHLEVCEEKLDQCFQMLGQKSMAHWKNQQKLDEKEKASLFAQIETLKAEKEKLRAAMTALLTPVDEHSPPDTSPPESPDAPVNDTPETNIPKENT